MFSRFCTAQPSRVTDRLAPTLQDRRAQKAASHACDAGQQNDADDVLQEMP